MLRLPSARSPGTRTARHRAGRNLRTFSRWRTRHPGRADRRDPCARRPRSTTPTIPAVSIVRARSARFRRDGRRGRTPLCGRTPLSGPSLPSAARHRLRFGNEEMIDTHTHTPVPGPHPAPLVATQLANVTAVTQGHDGWGSHSFRASSSAWRVPGGSCRPHTVLTVGAGLAGTKDTECRRLSGMSVRDAGSVL